MPRHGRPSPTTNLEPVWIRPREGQRLTGLGKSRFAELCADGTFEAVKTGDARNAAVLIRYATIKNYRGRKPPAADAK